MSDPISGNVIGGIILEGMKLFSKERRLALRKEYMSLQMEVRDAENARYPNYSDVRVIKAKEKLNAFLSAYYEELKSIPAADPD